MSDDRCEGEAGKPPIIVFCPGQSVGFSVIKHWSSGMPSLALTHRRPNTNAHSLDELLDPG